MLFFLHVHLISAAILNLCGICGLVIAVFSFLCHCHSILVKRPSVCFFHIRLWSCQSYQLKQQRYYGKQLHRAENYQMEQPSSSSSSSLSSSSSSSSSLESHNVPWMGEGLSMPPSSYPVLCRPLCQIMALQYLSRSSLHRLACLDRIG